MFQKLVALTLALMCLTLPAMAETTTFEGTVVAGSSMSVTAPFGGIIDSFSLREGSVISLGDKIATVETTKVYAPVSGTITGIFGQPGDGVESISQRFGAVMYIVPQSRYQIVADIQYAYNSTENKYVNIGETVYLSCTSDGSHTGEGTVTAVDGTNFTVETTSGEFLLEETVTVYRSSTYAYKTRIGRGAVSRTSEVAVGGNGSILYMHVADGDTVQRGDLLFETVTGDLDGLYATTNEIVSTVSGIIASVDVHAGSSVNKGQTLITVYPQDALLIEINISEFDLGLISEGDAVTFTLGYQEDNPKTYTGTVDMISYLSDEQSGDVVYRGYISFDASADIRLGMTASVTTVE